MTGRWFTILKSMMVLCVYVLGWSIGLAATHWLVTLFLGFLTVAIVTVAFVSEEGKP